MWTLFRPDDLQLERALAHATTASFTGPTSDDGTLPCPVGYRADEYRIRLGRGVACFLRGVDALNDWRQFPGGWVSLYPANVPPRVGASFVVQIQCPGFWWLCPDRVVGVDRDAADTRYAVTYSTLVGHAERGIERFSIVRDAQDAVDYVIHAVSRPAHPCVWLGWPLARWLQRSFAFQSLEVMRREVNS